MFTNSDIRNTFKHIEPSGYTATSEVVVFISFDDPKHSMSAIAGLATFARQNEFEVGISGNAPHSFSYAGQLNAIRSKIRSWFWIRKMSSAMSSRDFARKLEVSAGR